MFPHSSLPSSVPLRPKEITNVDILALYLFFVADTRRTGCKCAIRPLKKARARIVSTGEPKPLCTSDNDNHYCLYKDDTGATRLIIRQLIFAARSTF
ncbi:hypothetical protein PILCRDRAFT_328297 [Piloderma croceum F 1598]|uniref:Uncharacterized protein n=1 Tax=Piloderma croceum (strain F 1598) TaxID=765440 RepID=A0A0C3FPB9_PILCF|nr:hypothetical protein PILCRDRAFT_328297 [Piloderma croceum F 1598]